MFKQSFR